MFHAPNDTNCNYLMDLIYTTNCYRTDTTHRACPTEHNNILNRYFEQELLVFERIQVPHQEQEPQRRHLFRYNNKRCNCKIKQNSSCTNRRTSNGHPGRVITDSGICPTRNCHLCDINCEICISDSSNLCPNPYLRSRAPIITTAAPTTTLSVVNSSKGPAEDLSSRQWWSRLSDFSTDFVGSLYSHLKSMITTAYKSPPTSSFIDHYSLLSKVHSKRTKVELGSNVCDTASNYLHPIVNINLSLLKFKPIHPSQSPSPLRAISPTTPVPGDLVRTLAHSSPQHQFSFTAPQPTYYYLLMIFMVALKRIVRFVSNNMNRMRRTTQLLLPIAILLQLLMVAPLTICTSSPNHTSTASASPAPAPWSLSASAHATSSVTSKSVNPPISSAPSSVKTSASSAAPKEKTRIENFKIHQHHIPDTEMGGSYRPSGGSSITSYVTKLRRDPGLGFSSTGCHSCRMREQVKADNLESIKRHILLRLEMQTLPNITVPEVPQEILENFYKNNSYVDMKTSQSSSSGEDLMYTTLSLSQGANRHIPATNIEDNNMQGDDPTVYSDDYGQSGNDGFDDDKDQDYSDNAEDEFFSIVNSVYVFPTIPRMRHNRKTEILNFKIKNTEHSSVSQALLHVYIRGRDWMRESDPGVYKVSNGIGGERRDITILINRVVRRVNSTVATHTVNVTESRQKIPNGLGKWVSIDVTQLVQGWLHNTTTNQGIIIKCTESWMKPYIITGDSAASKASTVYIEMLIKDNRKRRTKRSTSMNCSESDNEERCCRYPLVVNFRDFDWPWVVAPSYFNAYFCNGECKLGFLEKYPHTHLMQLSTAPQPCCSPSKMSPLRLLYFNNEHSLVMSTIPNMSVEKCSCS